MAEDKNRYITTGERIRNYTGIAFVIAILIELVLAPFYHNPTTTETAATAAPITVARQTIKPPPTPPPPTPTPPPSPQPHQQQQQPHPNPRPLTVHLQHTTSHGAGPSEEHVTQPVHGSENGVPSGTGTASPAPAAPAGCANPYQEAHTLQEASPEYPQSAIDLGLGRVEVTVIVTIGPSGNLESATIGSGSGNSAIDHDALRVARLTTYAPKMENCQPITSQYKYLVDYNPD
ncbi:MAG TPA: energy transducer TonB [Candidatus Tyrphobacter sp.]